MSTNDGEKLEHYPSEPNSNKDWAVWHHFEIIVSKDPNEENTLKTTLESIALLICNLQLTLTNNPKREDK